MIKNGGLAHYIDLADKRAKLIYNYIDSSMGFYSNKVDKRYRSKINVPLRIQAVDQEDAKAAFRKLELKFLNLSTKQGLVQLKGMKQGIRISMYNAMPIEGVERLISFMEEFR